MRRSLARAAGAALVVFTLAGCGRADSAAPAKGDETMALKVTSEAFADGQPIPRQHTGEGEDKSPPLKWDGAPKGVKSFALICDDPDAPRGTWVHWVSWNIPAEAKGLDEEIAKKSELPDGSMQGLNSWPKIGYNGPMPPPGKPHRYYFKVYALDTKLTLQPGAANKEQLLAAMKGHVLAEGQTMGTYQRK